MQRKFSTLSYTLLTTIILMVLHIVEEVVTKFWLYDPGVLWAAQVLHTTPFVFYILLVIIAFAILIPAFVSSLGGKVSFFLKLLVGAIFLVQAAQLRNYFIGMGYFPGIVSSAALTIVGIYYWQKFLRQLY